MDKNYTKKPESVNTELNNIWEPLPCKKLTYGITISTDDNYQNFIECEKHCWIFGNDYDPSIDYSNILKDEINKRTKREELRIRNLDIKRYWDNQEKNKTIEYEARYQAFNDCKLVNPSGFINVLFDLYCDYSEILKNEIKKRIELAKFIRENSPQKSIKTKKKSNKKTNQFLEKFTHFFNYLKFAAMLSNGIATIQTKHK